MPDFCLPTATAYISRPTPRNQLPAHRRRRHPARPARELNNRPQLAGGRIWFCHDAKLAFLLNPGPALVAPSVLNPSDPDAAVDFALAGFTLTQRRACRLSLRSPTSWRRAG